MQSNEINVGDVLCYRVHGRTMKVEVAEKGIARSNGYGARPTRSGVRVRRLDGTYFSTSPETEGQAVVASRELDPWSEYAERHVVRDREAAEHVAWIKALADRAGITIHVSGRAVVMSEEDFTGLLSRAGMEVEAR